MEKSLVEGPRGLELRDVSKPSQFGFLGFPGSGDCPGSVTHTTLSSCWQLPSLKSREVGHQNPGEGGGEQGWKEPRAGKQRAGGREELLMSLI